MIFYAYTRNADYTINKIYDMTFLNSVLLPNNDAPIYVWVANNMSTSQPLTVLLSSAFNIYITAALFISSSAFILF